MYQLLPVPVILIGPNGIAIDMERNLFVTEYYKHRIRKISIE